MLLYSDIISGDEICSDAFKMKLIDNIVYEVDCKMITVKDGDVDIGANASAEEQEEVLEDGAKTVNDVVHSFRLQSTTFDKKSYLTHLKVYMKKVKEEIKAGTDAETAELRSTFEKDAQTYAKKIVANFKDYDFYVGESMNPEGMVALLNFREDGITPYFTLWKHGLKEVKL